MWNLVIKDILLQKRSLGFTLFFLILIFYVFSSNQSISGSMYVVGAIGLYYIYSVRVAYAEFKNNTEVILLSLPVTRLDVVVAKYFSLLANAGLAILLMGALGAVSSLFLHIRYLNWSDVAAVFMIIGLMGAVTIPVYAKFGVQWGRIVNLFLFMAIVFSAHDVINYLGQVQPGQAGLGLLVTLVSQHSWLPVALTLALLLFILGASYLVTFRLYLNKDY